MAKERKPIATRTRNRTKSQNGNSKSSVTSFSPPVKAANIKTPPTVKPFTKGVNRAKPKQSHKHQEDGSENKDLQYRLPYLPKSNLDMYLQELDRLPLSFVRGATVEKRRDILRNDNDECDYYSRFTLDDDEHDNTKEQLSFLLNNSMAPDAESNTNYFTCLHRAFIKKRYLSDQECMHLAKYVNCDFYTRSLQELAMLIKDEFYMYRIDFTQRHLNHIRTMNITEEAFLQNEKGLEKVLEQQLNEEYLRYFWGSWIIEPFVDTVSFFSISENKDLLAKITARTTIEHLKYFLNIISTNKLDEELKKMDNMSIAIILPS